jgi:FtsZ-interacting cell division protein YlmF
MKFFGFESDDDDYDDDDYQEERRTTPKRGAGRREAASRSSSQGNPNAAGRLVLYRGVAPDNDRRRLREAFNEGAFILIDLNDLDTREFEDRGRDFVTFMGGVAFARGGEIVQIKPAQFLLSPRADMFDSWPEDSEQE